MFLMLTQKLDQVKARIPRNGTPGAQRTVSKALSHEYSRGHKCFAASGFTACNYRSLRPSSSPVRPGSMVSLRGSPGEEGFQKKKRLPRGYDGVFPPLDIILLPSSVHLGWSSRPAVRNIPVRHCANQRQVTWNMKCRRCPSCV